MSELLIILDKATRQLTAEQIKMFLGAEDRGRQVYKTAMSNRTESFPVRAKFFASWTECTPVKHKKYRIPRKAKKQLAKLLNNT